MVDQKEQKREKSNEKDKRVISSGHKELFAVSNARTFIEFKKSFVKEKCDLNKNKKIEKQNDYDIFCCMKLISKMLH